jgi:hypothetical protein
MPSVRKGLHRRRGRRPRHPAAAGCAEGRSDRRVQVPGVPDRPTPRPPRPLALRATGGAASPSSERGGAAPAVGGAPRNERRREGRPRGSRVEDETRVARSSSSHAAAAARSDPITARDAHSVGDPRRRADGDAVGGRRRLSREGAPVPPRQGRPPGPGVPRPRRAEVSRAAFGLRGARRGGSPVDARSRFGGLVRRDDMNVERCPARAKTTLPLEPAAAGSPAVRVETEGR